MVKHTIQFVFEHFFLKDQIQLRQLLPKKYTRMLQAENLVKVVTTNASNSTTENTEKFENFI